MQNLRQARVQSQVRRWERAAKAKRAAAINSSYERAIAIRNHLVGQGTAATLIFDPQGGYRVLADI